MDTITIPTPNVAAQFEALATEWHNATRFLSNPTATVAHPAYQAIIALGPPVIPLLLAELAKSAQPWFAALRELTGVNPVPADDRGHPRAAAAHWLAWGRNEASF